MPRSSSSLLIALSREVYFSQSRSVPTLREVHVQFRLVWLTILLLSSLPTVSQNRETPVPPTTTDITPQMAEADEVRARMMHDLEKKAAKERVAALKNDTDKLLKLSVELKSYVEKSDENVLSLTVVKKAEEIEKLAKSVKDKMKGPN